MGSGPHLHCKSASMASMAAAVRVSTFNFSKMCVRWIFTVLSLIPRMGVQEVVYQRLRQAHPRLQVYRKPEVPAPYHYREHPRIPPIIGVADEGWIVTTRSAMASSGNQRPARGGHGYPPDVVTMRAIFLARGPAFGSNIVVEPFQSIHVYVLLAHVLGLEPGRNDGALDSIYPVLAEPSKRP